MFLSDHGSTKGALVPSPNGFLLSLTQDYTNRNWSQFTLTYDGTQPPWDTPNLGSYTLRWETSETGAAGPWAPAPLTEYATECTALPSNVTSIADLTTEIEGIGGLGEWGVNTDHWVRITVIDINNAEVDQWVQGPFRTADYPVSVCLNGVVTRTSYEAALGVTSGDFNFANPCDLDKMRWEISTHPAGPWTTTGNIPIDDFSPTHTFTGLAPSTQYYWRSTLIPADGTAERPFTTCSFTTLEAPDPQPEGPCDPPEFTPDCCPAAANATPERILRARQVAAEWMWILSGRRVIPQCAVTVRPCRKMCGDLGPGIGYAYTGFGSPWIPYLGRDGLWRNASVCGCTGDCSCNELCEIYLPGPVFKIVEVNESGTILPTGAYRVDNGNTLVRTDGNCWPDCQAMEEPPGAPNTLTVTYQVGVPLDALGQLAFDAAVCHLLSECQGTGACSCRIPPNVTRLNRQGVEQEFKDVTELQAAGLSGIPALDRWVMLINPYNQRSVSRVWSPDFKTPRITTRY